MKIWILKENGSIATMSVRDEVIYGDKLVIRQEQEELHETFKKIHSQYDKGNLYFLNKNNILAHVQPKLLKAINSDDIENIKFYAKALLYIV